MEEEEKGIEAGGEGENDGDYPSTHLNDYSWALPPPSSCAVGFIKYLKTLAP